MHPDPVSYPEEKKEGADAPPLPLDDVATTAASYAARQPASSSTRDGHTPTHPTAAGEGEQIARPRRGRPGPVPAEIEAAAADYNAAAVQHGFTRCTALTADRRSKLGKRLEDIGGLDAFKRALSAIPRNDFLMGRRVAKDGGTPFRLDIDRLLSTKSGMGDVLAKLLDDANATAHKTKGADGGLQPGWWRNNPGARNLPAIFWSALLEGYSPGDPWDEESWGRPIDDPDCIVHPDVIRSKLGVERSS
jgi:hypothetical protein